MIEDRSAVSIPNEFGVGACIGTGNDALDSLEVSERSIHLEAPTPSDEPFLFATFASTRIEELAVTGWSEEQTEHFLRMQFEAQRRSYLNDLPDAQYSLIRCGTIPVGRLIVERTAEDIHIVDIALLTQFRKLGIGSILMRRILGEAEQTGKPVRLFVEKFNPALQWYQRMGFEVTSTGPIYLEMTLPVAEPGSSKPQVA